ncbi:MAG TPA: hypothetical protein VIM65_01275 [Cyclobacteriaceae bacterium]
MRYNTYKSIFNLKELLGSLKRDDVFVVHDHSKAQIVGFFTSSENAVAFQDFLNARQVSNVCSLSCSPIDFCEGGKCDRNGCLSDVTNKI